jgi:hypothetical protein
VEGLEVLSTGQAEFLVLTADGLDGTTWSSAGVGNVISDLDITDHTIVRGDGGVKGIQESGIAISDTDNITGVVDLTLTGDITSTGEASFTAATAGVSVINIDNGTDAYATALRPDGLVFAEGGATELGYSLVVGPKNDAAKADAITIEAGANAGAGDGGDILINAGNGAGAGTDGDILLGTLFTTNSVVLASTGITTTVSGPLTAEEGVGVTGDITVTGSIDGIADLNTDVTANTDHTGGDGSDHQDVADNTTHRGLTSDNPHGTSLENLVSGTHAQLNIAAADAGNIFASAVRNQVSSLDAMPTGTPAAGDLIAVEDISEPGGGKWKYVEASEFLASTAPTITDFTNAGHDHADAAGGGTIAYGDITGTPTAPTLTKSITIEDPAADEDISMFFTTVAITVTQITAVIVGSTSVSFDIEHGTSRATPTGTGVIGTDEVADSTTTGNITTSFTDETIPENSFVWLTTSNLSGTPTELNVTIEYTED